MSHLLVLVLQRAGPHHLHPAPVKARNRSAAGRAAGGRCWRMGGLGRVQPVHFAP